MKLVRGIFILTSIAICLYSCGNNPSPTPSEKVSVHLNSNGGSISKNIVEVDKGTTFSNNLFPTPTKQNHYFSKWTFMDDSDVSKDYVITEEITIKANYVITEDYKYIKSLDIKEIDNRGYFYSATYKDYNYELGRKFLDNYLPNKENGYYTGGNCSSFRINNFYGRNFDWCHGTIPEFIIKTEATESRHATLGVSFCLGLSNSDVNNSDAYHHETAPFTTVDGINDTGLCVSLNEVDKRDVGTNSGSNPGASRMNSMMVCRYLLDYAETVTQAEQLLATQDVYTSRWINEQHIMIADSTGDTAIIEFVPISSNENGTTKKKIVFYRDDESKGQYFKNISTNFTFVDYMGDCKNWHGSSSSLQKHPYGTERYNILYEKLFGDQKEIPNNLNDVLSLMSNVYYTKTYTLEITEDPDEFWFSDYLYYTGDKTTERTAENFGEYREKYLKRYNSKIRSNLDWTCYYNTVHSSAYDLNNKKMKIVFEEDLNKSYEFSL